MTNRPGGALTGIRAQHPWAVGGQPANIALYCCWFIWSDLLSLFINLYLGFELVCVQWVVGDRTAIELQAPGQGRQSSGRIRAAQRCGRIPSGRRSSRAAPAGPSAAGRSSRGVRCARPPPSRWTLRPCSASPCPQMPSSYGNKIKINKSWWNEEIGVVVDDQPGWKL